MCHATVSLCSVACPAMLALLAQSHSNDMFYFSHRKNIADSSFLMLF